MKIFFIFSLCIFSNLAHSQYSELFELNDKGVEGPCTTNNPDSCTGLSDFTGVSWDLEGSISVLNIMGQYVKTISNQLEYKFLDSEICWTSPLLDISTASPVSLSLDLTWTNFDGNFLVMNDYIDVFYSVNSDPFTLIGDDHTVEVSGTNISDSMNVTESGISGDTLRLKVCTRANSADELASLDNVIIPENGVSLFAPPTVMATVEGGHLYIDDENGIVLKGQDGLCYLIFVNQSGVLTTKLVLCPD